MGKQRRRNRAPAPELATGEPGTSVGRGADITSWVSRPWFAPVLFALVALVYFWEFPLSDQIIRGEDVGTDFHKGKAPVLEKLKDLVPSAWDPRMGGYPISEEIRHKFFPTYLIELFTTKQRATGWRYLLVVFGAGWGMSLYLRQIGVGRAASLWGGMAYLSAPMFLSFPFAGQYAKMTVIALFPFLCLCLERGMDGGRRAASWWILLAVLIALGVFSPHLQMLQYALLGLGLYCLYKVVSQFREGMPKPRLLERIVLFSLVATLGLGLGAEGVLPAFLHVKTQSKRAAIQDDLGRSEAQQLAHARSWSLHPEEMASLVVPEFAGFLDPKSGQNHYWGRNPMKLNSEYFGILALILGVVAVPWARRRPLILFLVLFSVTAAAYTLGEHTPVHWLAYHLLPGGKVLRAIGQAAFLFAFPAIALAAIALHGVLDGPEAQRRELSRRVLRVGGFFTGLALIAALAPGVVLEAWTAVLWSDIPDANRQAMLAGAGWAGRGAFLVACVAGGGTALLVLRLKNRLGVAPVVLGLIALTLVDTWRIDRLFLRYEDPARWTDFRHTNPSTVEFLRRQPGRFRLFPLPGYGFLSDPRFHLEGADIVTAFNNYTLRRYDRLLQELRPVEHIYTSKLRGQQVSWSDDQLLVAIQPLLNLVNARYIVTPRPMELTADAFPEVSASEGVRLYSNPGALPWFQLLSHAVVMEEEGEILQFLRDGRLDLREVVVLEGPPQISLPGPEADRSGDSVTPVEYDYHDGVIRVKTQATGARMLVVSDNYHPNWEATIDGDAVEIVRANYVWRAVPVPAGEHDVEFTYHSAPVAIARVISGGSLLILLVWGGTILWRRRSGPSPVS
ncbi:MAG TPA: YfhO family protein [Candidatus Latescibacteria bacterium]|nr:YfhO family protein [Candidatus Latescibacterota bacterium]HJP31280.1 YfhO family protein [Candidatus Latescibacterota bacterium]